MVTFDDKGVCNYCKSHIPIGKKPALHVLEDILSQYRSKDNTVDCVVTFSGGRDSCFALYLLMKQFNMHPLAVTYDWGLMTPEARINWKLTKEKLDIEHIIIEADKDRIRRNIKQNITAWLKKPHMGMIPLFTEGDKTMEYHISKLAKQKGISLVVTGNGNSFERTRFKMSFFGVNEDAESNELSARGHTKLMLRYMIEYLRNPGYINSSIMRLLNAYFVQYILAYEAKNSNWIKFFQYVPWNENEILATIRRELNWESPKDTVLTWRIDDGTAPFYNYLYYKMVGFTENDTFRSNQIRNGILLRGAALEIVKEENKPRYEAIKRYLEFVGLDYDSTMKRINEIAELHNKKDS
ncbi:MAG: hypothetical protein ISS92_00180 [Candidatus Omnitrophica bacterium]|nr:hypothetical protein [Candidatus Omnitrophota bacterium]